MIYVTFVSIVERNSGKFCINVSLYRVKGRYRAPIDSVESAVFVIVLTGHFYCVCLHTGGGGGA